MKDFIECGALLKTLRGRAIAKYPSSFTMGLLAAANEVETEQAADVVEVKHGRWKSVGLAGLKCSKCGHEDHWKMYYSYCPNCGAIMDGGKENADD